MSTTGLRLDFNESGRVGSVEVGAVAGTCRGAQQSSTRAAHSAAFWWCKQAVRTTSVLPVVPNPSSSRRARGPQPPSLLLQVLVLVRIITASSSNP
jgi:hypothetical protein